MRKVILGPPAFALLAGSVPTLARVADGVALRLIAAIE